jgi:hypothetical protein
MATLTSSAEYFETSSQSKFKVSFNSYFKCEFSLINPLIVIKQRGWKDLQNIANKHDYCDKVGQLLCSP